ncbi:MAG TPA: hypothetical protein VGV17_03160 [Bosea sp. (in: a-proteobacteria)]|jgi:hypothetical protein|uniref:hypothetical protein n=1 Tax=Bosea sp. (in: a-proteobacteria) TaxID=1871050 RepID=UPI002DDDB6A9|nr:hypothetical protein [Bosea sp. (in: a-proteobacteria)]HEV2552745.1 hypothetical protein [Bosea sp. (in: a-proteobacteria)]
MTLSSVDLLYFTDYDRPDHLLASPWSEADFSYASNNHVFVRVPRIAGVPERECPPDVGRQIDAMDFADCDWEMPRLPPLQFLMEPVDAGDQTCLALIRETVDWQGAIFDLRYFHLLNWLPNLRLGRSRRKHKPLPFVFAGGLGGLMPCKAPLTPNHHKLGEARA